MRKLFLFIVVNVFILNVQCQSADTLIHKVGDKFGGGTVFSVDGSGQHGLIAATKDLAGFYAWGHFGISGASFMDEGDTNTVIIVRAIDKYHSENNVGKWMLHEGDMAAYNCDKLVQAGYSDWFLPSINELKQMYDNQRAIGYFIMSKYCSSTEYNEDKFWSVFFEPKDKIIMKPKLKYSAVYSVRCIRQF